MFSGHYEYWDTFNNELYAKLYPSVFAADLPYLVIIRSAVLLKGHLINNFHKTPTENLLYELEGRTDNLDTLL